MRKVLFFLLFIMVVIPSFAINAITYDDTNNVGYKKVSSEETILSGGVIHTKDQGYTIRDDKNYSQQVNVLSMETNEDAKVATWAVINDDNSGFIRTTVAKIAKDYEEKHPGWKVVGGINADQFYTKPGTKLTVDGSAPFYPQPYYPMIADYEKWFSITATPYLNGNVVGFLNDGSTDQLYYQNSGWSYDGEDKAEIVGLVLSILKDGVIHKFNIEHFNKKPLAGESSIYSPYYVDNKINELVVDGENIFVVGKADLAYTSNFQGYAEISPHNQNAFFGKGIITEKVTNVTLSKGQFAIQTNNQDLLNLLEINDYCIAQFEYEGKLNEVESAIGFHTIMRMDDKDLPMIGTYNSSLYPRAMFGRRSDGSIVFVTVDGRQASQGMTGINMEEGNAILKHYGIVEGYQLDGGGSVTMVVRDGNDFVTVNSPSDGSDRQVLNALLFVVRDIEIETTTTIKTDSIVFNVNVLDDVQKIYIKLNDEIKEVVDGKVEFLDLSPNTSYKYQYLYKKNDKLTSGVGVYTIYTAKRKPILEHVLITSSGEDVVIKLIYDNPDDAITNIRISIGDVSKNLRGQEAIFEDMKDVDLTNLLIVYKYDLNDGNQEVMEEINNANLHPDFSIFMKFISNYIPKKVISIYK